MTSEPLTRITVDPTRGGRACVRGMRIRVTEVLDLHASGLKLWLAWVAFRPPPAKAERFKVRGWSTC